MGFEIINTLKKEKGLTNAQIARLSGVTLSTLDKITSGINKNPKLDTLQAICGVLGCTLNDFVDTPTGESEKLLYSPEEENLVKKYRVLDLYGKEAVDSVLNIEYKRFYNHLRKDNTEGIDNITYLKYFDFAVSAGTGEPLGEGSPSKRMAFPTEIVPENAHYCLRVNGHSMEPAYEDGDIVFVQRMDTFVREGEIGIFVFNGEGYIKQLGHQELISLNPEYPPLPIGPFDRCDCQGRVLGKV